MTATFPLILVLLAGVPGPQDAASPPDAAEAPVVSAAESPRPIQVRLNAGVYLPRLVGTTRLGPSAAARQLDFRTTLRLNEQEAVPFVEVSLIRNERWELQFSGFDYESRRSGAFPETSDYGGLSLAPGDPFRARARLSGFGVELSRRLWRFYEDDADVSLVFSPTFGARLFDLTQIIEEVGVGREEFRADYLNAFAGIQMDMQWRPKETISWLERLELEAGIFAGPAFGADSGFGWTVRASLHLFFNEHVSFLFGYRLFELNLDDGPYEISGGLQGVFIGGTIDF